MSGTTSDGIPSKEWERIHELSLRYANSVTAGRHVAAERARRGMLRALNLLEATFGRRPSILATKGEYVKRSSQRQQLLLEAFESAKRRRDAKNLTLISSSLAEFYADEMRNPQEAGRWASQLEKALGTFFDKSEAAVLKSVRRKLE